jgi:preprotein translocase subunit SecF
MSRVGELGNKLYSGELSYDFIGKRKTWYAFSAVILLISIGALLVKGLTLGIEFRGGAEFRVDSPKATEGAVRDVVADVHGGQITVQKVGDEAVRVQTEALETEESREIQASLAKRFDLTRDDISTQVIGPSWGADISKKALRALMFFLLFVMAFLSLYFEWKMAVAAMVALVHDLVITAGVYALVGFEVTPATVIGFLTILGYSLYDTVVVFDKVRENTRSLAGGSRMTYSGASNLAVNQTLVRSINTSVVALLPIAAILTVGVVLLGSGPLKDLALALFVGVAAGAYSSIFIATPVLCALKEREPAMQALERRVAARQTGGRPPTPAGAPSRKRAAATTAARSGVPYDTYEADPIDEATGDDDMGAPVPEPAGAGAQARAARTQAARAGGGTQRNQPKRPTKNRPNKKRR